MSPNNKARVSLWVCCVQNDLKACKCVTHLVYDGQLFLCNYLQSQQVYDAYGPIS